MVHLILFAVFALAVAVRKQKHLQWFPFFVLFLFAAVRYMYGNDYQSYLIEYEYIKGGMTTSFGGEYLYTLLNLLSPSFYVLIAVTSAVFVLCVYRLIKTNVDSRYVWVGTFIFIVNPQLFLVNLSALRQCLAMLCFIPAVYFASKRKPILYILLIAAAAMFHKSAWILLPVYIFCSERKPKRLLTALILIGVFGVTFLFDVQEIAEAVVALFNDKNYIHYVTQDMSNTLRATLLTSVLFVYVLVNLHRLEKLHLVFGKMYLLATIFGILAYQISMFTRVQMYFDLFSVVTLPAILCKVNQESGTRAVTRFDGPPFPEFFRCINKFVLPALIFIIYCLRYYSFFHNPMWEPFYVYQTLLKLI